MAAAAGEYRARFVQAGDLHRDQCGTCVWCDQFQVEDVRAAVAETITVCVERRMQQQRARGAYDRTIGTALDIAAFGHERRVGGAVPMRCDPVGGSVPGFERGAVGHGHMMSWLHASA